MAQSARQFEDSFKPEGAAESVACKNCGYDLRGVDPGRCPECGRDGPDPFPSVRAGVLWLAATPGVLFFVFLLLELIGVLDAVGNGAASVGLSNEVFWFVVAGTTLVCLMPWTAGSYLIASRTVVSALPGSMKSGRRVRLLTSWFGGIACAWALMVQLVFLVPAALLAMCFVVAAALMLLMQIIAVHNHIRRIGEAAGSRSLARSAGLAVSAVFLAGVVSLVVSGDMYDRYEHELVRHWIAIGLVIAFALFLEIRMCVLLWRVVKGMSDRLAFTTKAEQGALNQTDTPSCH